MSPPEAAAYADEPQPGEDIAEEPASLAGLGEQPSIAHGENDGREDRPGRRRRRGRRGGRRGRGDEGPREHQDGEPVEAHRESEAGNGALEPDAGHVEREPFHEERPATVAPEPARSERETPRYVAPVRESVPERQAPVERHWQAPVERHVSEIEAPRQTEPVVAAESPPPPRQAEPVHAQPVAEAAPEDPSRPVRKGWWQRKFSGE